MKNERTYLVSYEYLRVVAILAVVLLHTFSLSLFIFEPVHSFNWWIGNFVASTTHWAVPVFIMISGALHLGKTSHNPLSFYAKKTRRLLFPLVIFVFFFTVFDQFINGEELNIYIPLYQILFDEPFKHLYFLIVLFALFLITPFLNSILSKYPQRSLILFFLSLLYTLGIRPTRFIGLFWIPFLSYYLAGYFVEQIQRKFRTSVLFLFICDLILLTMIGTALFTTHTIPNSDGFYWFGISSPLTILLSYSIFLITPTFPTQKSKMSLISNSTFGIYLIHPFFLTLFEFLVSDNLLYIIVRMTIFTLTTVSSFILVFFYLKMKESFRSSLNKTRQSVSEEV